MRPVDCAYGGPTDGPARSQRPEDLLQDRRRGRARRRRSLLHRRQGPDARHRRRVGVRQECHVPHDHGPQPEAMQLHEDVSHKQARARGLDLLKAVGIPRAERRLDDYPHQFSGGMRQRMMIAMALINDPDLLIADEPTTALDVTTQAQIISLMKRLQEDFGSAIIFITHDLGVVAETADDVLVMYAAKVVEQATVYDLFNRPQHPYTWGLMGSLPRLETDVDRLTQIPGQPPSLLRPPRGCRFHPRCPYVMEVCKTTVPQLLPTQRDQNHLQRCHLDEET